MSEKAKLARGSIAGHLVGQTAPAIIGVAAIMSIGLVDSYFIGQLGREELAAIAFIFPVGVALASLGVGVMVGVNSVVARALGEGESEKAARRANFGIVFAVIVGIVLGLLLFAVLDPLFRLMNANDAMMPLIRSYMQPFALGFPLQLAIMGLNGVLRGQGEARRTSIVSISYAAANWILDPILITGAFGFQGLGMVGAAYATLIGWAIGVVVAALLIRQTHLPLNPMLLRNCSLVDPATSILKVAGPAAFSNAINPIGLSILTALVAQEGLRRLQGSVLPGGCRASRLSRCWHSQGPSARSSGRTGVRASSTAHGGPQSVRGRSALPTGLRLPSPCSLRASGSPIFSPTIPP